MATKEAYREKFQAQLNEWDARLDVLNARVRKAKADARIGFENEVGALRRQRADAHKMFVEMGERGENAWDDIRVGADKAWAEMNKAIDKVAARFK